ncbi:MAG: FmdB family zinc ribbon protein [Acidobacteriota bacterium]
MPIFEYRCQKCETVFERIIFRASEDEILCPSCRSVQVEKLPSTFAVSSDSPKSNSRGECAPGGT